MIKLSHLIYPLTVRVAGHHRWFRNQFPPFFPVLHCPLGLGELQACPVPDVVFPLLPLSTLSSSPFHFALQDGFGQTWWTGDTTIPLQCVSLRWSGLRIVRVPAGSWHGLPRLVKLFHVPVWLSFDYMLGYGEPVSVSCAKGCDDREWSRGAVSVLLGTGCRWWKRRALFSRTIVSQRFIWFGTELVGNRFLTSCEPVSYTHLTLPTKLSV